MENKVFKKIVIAVIVVSIYASVASAEDKEGKEVFELGIRSALNVLTYEKEKSISYSGVEISERYCISLYSGDKRVLEPFDVVKMESLSLNLGYEPAYLKYTEVGESKNIFCFDISDTRKESKAKLSAIGYEYRNIKQYYPKIVKLKEGSRYTRVIPFMGEWSKDMSHTVNLLNSKINTQKEKIEALELKLRKRKKAIRKMIMSFDDITDNSLAKKSVEVKRKARTKKKESIKDKASPVKVKKEEKSNIKKSTFSSRVFTIDSRKKDTNKTAHKGK